MKEENKNGDNENLSKVENKKDLKPQKISYFFELLKVIIWALIIIIPVRTFIFQPFFVQGSSMEPNFHNGEYLIIKEWGYKQTTIYAKDKKILQVDSKKDFLRGDVIVFRYPNNPKEFFIKRVIGLPNEKVEIKKGKVMIYNSDNPNGFELNESEYLPSVASETNCQQGFCSFNLSDSQYVVLGDNRSHSSDSRMWGTLSKNNIIGKVLLRAWPLRKFDTF